MEPSAATREIAAEAARLVVETGLEYASAKSKAARALGRAAGGRAEMPSNELVEDEVRAYLELYCADTQPQELAALRALAERWMERLAPLRPHLSGAVWRGTATRLSSVRLELYCDDPKAAELHLPFDVDTLDPGGPRPRDVLTIMSPCRELGERVALHLLLHDYDELRGALKPDARGRTWRGDLAALRRRLHEEAAGP
jgi:hypothetical protein